MTAAAMKKAATLSSLIEKNSEKVNSKIVRPGRKEDRAIASSSAKYYPALKKLAER